MLRRIINLMIFIGVVTTSAGCASIGPQTIPRDRIDYSEAIANSMHRQMLLNIIRLRYGEMPLFLDVSSVINQYTATGSASVLAIPDGESEFGAGGSYTDRPTVTFSPLTGEKFTTSLLTPLSPLSLVALIQSGWPVEDVFRICVRRINGIPNVSSGLLQSEGDPVFEELLAHMGRLQRSGQFALRLRETETADFQTEHSVFLMLGKPSAELQADGRRLREILQLDAESDEVEISYGVLPSQTGEIAILSRSVLDIMLEMAYSANVPTEDIATGRAGESLYDSPEGPDVGKLIQIHSGENPPDGTRLSVNYRNNTFWIDDTDLRSKKVLVFLLMLFSLSEGESAGTGPVLTIN